MKTRNWNAVMASVPKDKDTAIVGHGLKDDVTFEPKGKISKFRTHKPYKTHRYVRDGMADYTGLEIGRLKVIGLVINRLAGLADNEATWAVQCACGYYELRKARTLKRIKYALVNGESRHDDRCSECRYIRELKAGNVSTDELEKAIRKERGSK